MRNRNKCEFCGKKYIYTKWYNKHLRKKHAKKMRDIENSSMNIICAINRKKIMESLNKEAMALIELQRKELTWLK
jgi:hypothetical protein